MKTEIIKFIEHDQTWLELEENSEAGLYYTTRQNGDCGAEEPGTDDLKEANRLANKVRAKFKVPVTLDYIDEWVTLFIGVEN